MRLYELRKNPNQNKKVSIADAIQPYLDGNHYFSFRDDMKIGINPKSDFATPNGVYAWPKGQIGKSFGDDGSINAPYADDAPYVYVLKPTTKVIKTSDIPAGFIPRALNRLEVYYDRTPREKGITVYDTPYQKFHLQTQDWALEVSKWENKSLWTNIWRTMFVYVGIKALLDDTATFIGPDEPSMIVFFTNDAYEVVDVLLNRAYTKIDPREIRFGQTGYFSDEQEKRDQNKSIDQRKKGTNSQYQADRD